MRFVPNCSASDTRIPTSTSANARSTRRVNKCSEKEGSTGVCAHRIKTGITKRTDVEPMNQKAPTLLHRVPLLQLKSPPPDVCATTRILNSRGPISICENKSSRKSPWISRPFFRASSSLSDSSKSSFMTVRKSQKLVRFNERRNVTYNPDPDRIIDDEYFQRMWWNGKDRARCIKRRNREIDQLLTLEENLFYREAVLTITKFCQCYQSSIPVKNSQEPNDVVGIKNIHRAIGVLVTSRSRGLERIVSKSLQIQQKQLTNLGPVVDSIDKSDEPIENSSALYIRRCILKYQEQLRSSATSDCVISDDNNEIHPRHHSDDPALSLAAYSQSLERHSRSLLWAQFMAMGDAAVVAAYKKRSL